MPRPVTVRTAQPSIPVVAGTKTVLPTSADAGDTVTYTVTFTAANGADNADAFEARLVDDLTAPAADQHRLRRPDLQRRLPVAGGHQQLDGDDARSGV